MSILNRIWPFSAIERQRRAKEIWAREALDWQAKDARRRAQCKRASDAAHAANRARKAAKTAELQACRP